MASNPKSILRRVMPTAHRVLIERFIKREFIGIEGRVLVIGAGHDPYRDLLPNAESVVVTDISSESGMIDEVADAHDLQYENESFDVVIAIEVFEHLPPSLCNTRMPESARKRGDFHMFRTFYVPCSRGSKRLPTSHPKRPFSFNKRV